MYISVSAENKEAAEVVEEEICEGARENTIFSCILPSVQDTIFETMLWKVPSIQESDYSQG